MKVGLILLGIFILYKDCWRVSKHRLLFFFVLDIKVYSYIEIASFPILHNFPLATSLDFPFLTIVKSFIAHCWKKMLTWCFLACVVFHYGANVFLVVFCVKATSSSNNSRLLYLLFVWIYGNKKPIWLHNICFPFSPDVIQLSHTKILNEEYVYYTSFCISKCIILASILLHFKVDLVNWGQSQTAAAAADWLVAIC